MALAHYKSVVPPCSPILKATGNLSIDSRRTQVPTKTIKKKPRSPRRRYAPTPCVPVVKNKSLIRSLFDEFEQEAETSTNDRKVPMGYDANQSEVPEVDHLAEIREMYKEEDERTRKSFIRKFGFDLKEGRAVKHSLWVWSEL